MEYVVLADIAKELGMDRSNCRKYLIKNDFQMFQVRTKDSHGQATLALTLEDAEAVRALRQKQGFNAEFRAPVENGEGFFYVIRLVPDLDPNRVKLGWTYNVEERLAAHRTAAPTAELVRCWKCRKVWELAAMSSITRVESKLIANEVYQCEDVDRLVERGNEFFALMPYGKGS